MSNAISLNAIPSFNRSQPDGDLALAASSSPVDTLPDQRVREIFTDQLRGIFIETALPESFGNLAVLREHCTFENNRLMPPEDNAVAELAKLAESSEDAVAELVKLAESSENVAAELVKLAESSENVAAVLEKMAALRKLRLDNQSPDAS